MITTLTNSKNNLLMMISVIITVGFMVLALVLDTIFVALFPLAIVGGFLLIQDLRFLYFLFALVIPFSIEIELPGGLGTDLPSEPIMWLLTCLAVPWAIYHLKNLDGRLWTHPITLLLLLHISWIGITSFMSESPVLSVKYFLAKTWYVVPFYFLFYYVFKNEKRRKVFFDLVIACTGIAIMIVMVRHAMEGFSFAEINRSVYPIFRNHVSYGVMLVALLPYLYIRMKEDGGWRRLLLLLFLLAIYLSYTRAAILAVLIGALSYLVIRWRLTRQSIVVALLSVCIAVPYFLSNNRYMDYTPEYERTIAHYQFDNLIEATYKLEDISTMERLYRWMAGIEMLKEKPFFGFGPATFYSYYQNYSITAFETYVSDNPEKSGIHNYYLMTAVEQGIPGMIIFVLLLIVSILSAEKIYHQSEDESARRWVSAAFAAIIMLAAILSINDLVEADKVGPFFFISLCIVVMLSRKEKKGEISN